MGFLMLTLADFSSFAWNFVPGTLCTHIPVYSHHKTATNAPYNSKTPLPQCSAYKPPPPTPNISPLNSLPTNRTWMDFSGLCRGDPTPAPLPLINRWGWGGSVVPHFQNPYSGRTKNGIFDFLGRVKKKDAHFQKDFSKFSQNRARFKFTDPDVHHPHPPPPPHWYVNH